MAPLALKGAAGWGDGRVNFNVAVSNVPGPADERFLMGARLEALYPVSVVTHGQILNITCTSYAGTLNFGVVACRDGLQHVQRIAVYIGEALTELEQELGVTEVAPASPPVAEPTKKVVKRKQPVKQAG